MRVLPDLKRSFPRVVRGRGGFWILFISGLALLEFLGRFSSSDFEDFLAASCLLLLIIAMGFRQGRRSQALIRKLRTRAREKLLAWAEVWCDLEADLRQKPELSRGLPRAQWRPTALILAAVPLLYAFAVAIDVDLRRGLSDFFYVGYLGLLVLLWALMFGCTILMGLFTVTILREIELPMNSIARRHPWQWKTALGFGGLVAVAGFLLAPTYAIVLQALVWTASCALLLWPGGPRLDFAFRTRTGDGQRRVTDWSQVLVIHTTLVMALPFVIALLGGGPAVVHGWDHAAFSSMPVTSFAAIGLTWVAVTTGAVWFVVMAKLVIPGRLSDPSRPREVCLHLRVPAGEIDDELRKLSQNLRGRVLLDDGGLERGRGAVELILRPDALDYRLQLDWPLEVTRDDLGQIDLQRRIDRRHELICRRLLFRSLRSLWKHVSGAELGEGEGVLVAPHHWFASGLTRDEGRREEDEERLQLRSEVLGPEFREAIPISARHELFCCLEALEIDLIYVERGVNFRQLRRVMRILFDVYDMHGGEQALCERDLTGVAGVRAVIHAFDFDEPFRSKVYPEPQYEGMGRARVLHLFRDRGEDEVLADEPVDFRGKPVPLLFG